MRFPGFGSSFPQISFMIKETILYIVEADIVFGYFVIQVDMARQSIIGHKPCNVSPGKTQFEFLEI